MLGRRFLVARTVRSCRKVIILNNILLPPKERMVGFNANSMEENERLNVIQIMKIEPQWQEGRIGLG